MSNFSNCRACGERIVFKPHPQNPQKLAPFNLDGEIHFATCKSRGMRGDEYRYIDVAPGTLTAGFKVKGDGNSQTLSVIVHAHDQEVRCQTMKTGEKIFFEITGEWESQAFVKAVMQFGREKGWVK